MPPTLLIDALGPQGDGIHRSAQGVVYVARALPGDTVEAEIRKAAGGVMRGEIVRVVSPSAHRVTAPCSQYDVCGGCTLQHADAAFYRAWKTDIVRTALRKQNIEPGTWAEPVFVPAGTRRRVTFAAVKTKGGVTLGYFRRRSHQVADISACLVAHPAIMGLRAKLAGRLAPILQTGKAADVFIQAINSQFDVAVIGPVGAKGIPDLKLFEAAAALAHDFGISRIAWQAHERDVPDVIVSVGPVHATFGVLDVALPPLAFLQPTAEGESALTKAVMAALPPKGVFADLFSGCGTFTGPMLARGRVDAYESDAHAVQALTKARGSKPLDAKMRDLIRNPLQAAELKRYTAVVFDPPRAGAEDQAKALAASNVPLVIGVSCSPVTFARDARLLIDGGYTFERLHVIDQFTWSHHVELVGVFRKSRG